MAAKSKSSACEPPTAAAAPRAAARPAECAKAARRMSESLRWSWSTWPWKSAAFCAWTWRQAWIMKRDGRALVAVRQLAVDLDRLAGVPRGSWPRSRRRGAAPAARRRRPRARRACPEPPAASVARSSRSRRSTCLRRRSPSMPRGASSSSAAVDQQRERRGEAVGACRGSASTSGIVVAQPRQVAVAREERGAHRSRVERARGPSPCACPSCGRPAGPGIWLPCPSELASAVVVASCA